MADFTIKTFDEKIHNTLKSWEKECDYDRYKFKYRY